MEGKKRKNYEIYGKRRVESFERTYSNEGDMGKLQKFLMKTQGIHFRKDMFGQWSTTPTQSKYQRLWCVETHEEIRDSNFWKFPDHERFKHIRLQLVIADHYSNTPDTSLDSLQGEGETPENDGRILYFFTPEGNPVYQIKEEPKQGCCPCFSGTKTTISESNGGRVIGTSEDKECMFCVGR